MGVEIITEFEQKLTLMPLSEKNSVQKVLISTLGPNDTLIARGYFDRFILLEDMIK